MDSPAPPHGQPKPSLACAAFRGEFRPYQAAVLDGAAGYLADGRVHIVAAPGSGKTVLGLELVRRLGEPALILSPTVVIAHQWGERFRDLFLPPDAAAGAYVSERLDRPGVLTSVTYQALHAAFNGLADGADEPSPAGGTAQDNRDPPEALIEALRRAGVKTVCLDEAHHLRREWQKTLEAFLQLIPDAKIIALTATPPFGAEKTEWERYTAVCGEIDQEIFAHELVRAGTLCPHQDYIYLSYPTAKERAAIAQHRERAAGFTRQLVAEGIVGEALRAGGVDPASRHLADA
ncbi:MAG: DEAD/DEAH box helicase family protein, partial [Bifidobacteriaceae bacterium]|nr:DEAD/DEAH box helicase family protein [Bifidobacteriaceae bacterium]